MNAKISLAKNAVNCIAFVNLSAINFLHKNTFVIAHFLHIFNVFLLTLQPNSEVHTNATFFMFACFTTCLRMFLYLRDHYYKENVLICCSIKTKWNPLKGNFLLPYSYRMMPVVIKTRLWRLIRLYAQTCQPINHTLAIFRNKLSSTFCSVMKLSTGEWKEAYSSTASKNT